MKLATNGIQMHLVDTGAGRPPLVFLHGLGWDHTLWQSATRRFAGAYRVIAGDTRGPRHALSRPVKPSPTQRGVIR